MRLLISTGEVSGDLQGSLLVRALFEEAKKRSISLDILALGGPLMKEAGAELIINTASIGAVGFFEVIPYVIPTLRAQAIADKLLIATPLEALVLIDYMGPNIRLGNKARKLLPTLPIIYYIAPQEWAWRFGESGSTDLIRFSSKILAIFQKEADFYTKRGGEVSWVGHPMVDNLKELPQRDQACKELGVDSSRRFLLVLPASRSQELRYLLPTLLRAAALLQSIDPSFFVLLPSGRQDFEIHLQKALEHFGVNGKVFASANTDKLKQNLFKVAELALSKSGTINMELALNCVPQIVGYKVSRITAFVAKRFLGFHVDHISPVNLLLNERLVPELVQKEFTAEKIVDLAWPLLEDQTVRSRMLDGYKKLKKGLGEPGATIRAAKEIFDIIKQ